MRSLRIAVAVLFLTAFVVACGEESLTAPNDLPTSAESAVSQTPDPALGNVSACRSVQFTSHQEGQFPAFAGTVSGDLEGTVDVALGFEVKFGGVTVHNPSSATWVITGGTVAELIGQTLLTEADAVLSFAPGQGAMGLMNGSERVVGGADRGNLTFHGTFDTSGFPLGVVDTEYRGVICP